LFRHSASDHVLVDVEIDGKPAVTAVVKEVQRHPYRPVFLHVDLHEVSMTEILRSMVPIEPTGTPVGVTAQGGVLEQPLFELEIECQAQALPELLEIDVSGLSIGDTLAVGDFVAPEGIRVITDPEIALFHVVAPRKSVEAEEEEAEAAEAAEAGAVAEED
jgi:large subunit ribosomal protein L25